MVAFGGQLGNVSYAKCGGFTFGKCLVFSDHYAKCLLWECFYFC